MPCPVLLHAPRGGLGLLEQADADVIGSIGSVVGGIVGSFITADAIKSGQKTQAKAAIASANIQAGTTATIVGQTRIAAGTLAPVAVGLVALALLAVALR